MAKWKSAMEIMERLTMKEKFWKNKRIFITGHTGFKGSWLSIWLNMLGAKLYGYALRPPTKPNLFEDAQVEKLYERSIIADIRDFAKLKEEIKKVKPEIIFHMAAQPLVRDSYKIPKDTYEVNVIGTVNLLEAVRLYPYPKVILNITTDKVYQNIETKRGYRENDPLGGYDPYSSSKACSEIVSSAYWSSFFDKSNVLLSTARAGNVIGGGDWAKDRLIPDILRAVLKNEKVLIRNPYSIRPWQYVLDVLNGYMILCEKMYMYGKKYCGAWNFGLDEKDLKTVEWIVEKLLERIQPNKGYKIAKGYHPHEAKLLVLNPDKAKKELGWKNKWNLEKSLDKICEWIKVYYTKGDIGKICRRQIREYNEE